MSTVYDQHFATLPAEQLTHALHEKLSAFYSYVSNEGYLLLWQAVFRAFYGRDEEGNHAAAFPGRRGSNGQFLKTKINVLGNLASHYLTLTTAERPTLQAVPGNTDLKSIAQAQLGSSLLDYYLTEKRLEDKLRAATQTCLLTGLAWVSVSWDATRGEVYDQDPETGRNVHEGDLSYRSLGPLDVCFDPNCPSIDDLDWVITRQPANRWDLAAKYPELKEQILSASMPREFTKRLELKPRSVSGEEDDTVYVWVFQHRKTEAVPSGRFAMFLDQNTMLQEGPLPYRKLNVFAITPSQVADQVVGHSMIHDLLSTQRSLDRLVSGVITQQSAFGVQNLQAPKGHGSSLKQLGQGMNLVETNPGKEIKPLNLLSTPAEVFSFIDRLEQWMESLSGINSVIRGTPDASLKSGSALALIQNEAQRFASGLQASYQRLLEEVALATIQTLQDYAKSERVAVISGKANRSKLKLFSGKDLEGVNRVKVQSVNSIAKTPAGRMQMADNLLQQKMITPSEYFEIFSTGQIEQKLEKEQAVNFLIRDIKEAVLDGGSYTPLMLDNHPVMIKELSSLLDAPSNREDPSLVQRVLDLIGQHMDLWRSAPADVLAVMGIPAPPPPAMPGGQLPPPQGEMPQGAPTPQDTGELMNPGSAQEAQQPDQPKLPDLPNGEPFEPTNQ